jgi:hypothetical protein
MNPSASTPLARLLHPFFADLEREGTRYCVLRGFDALPDATRNDVDLAVDAVSLPRVVELAHGAARASDWLVVGGDTQPGFQRLLLFHPEHEGGVLPIDLCTDHVIWGMRYADADAVLGSSRAHGVFRVARPGCEAAVSLLKGLVRHGVVKAREDHRARLRTCIQEDADGFRLCAEPQLGPALCDELIYACLRADFRNVESRAGAIRRTLARRAGVLRVATFAARAAVRTRLLPLRRRGGLEFRGGLFLCLLGPDGSGKTSFSRALEERIGGLFAETEQFHSLAGVLPKLKGLKKLWYGLRGRNLPDSPLKGVKQPGVVARPLPALRSATYVVYYGIEYFLYRLLVWRKLRHNHLVIFDRYFYDYYLMRLHRNAPRFLLDLFARVIARPDVLFVMLADPEAIFRRKPELTPEEIARQQEILKGLQLPGSAHLDTSISVERTLEDALAMLEPRLRGEPLPGSRSI